MLPGPKKKNKSWCKVQLLLYSVKLFVQNYNNQTLEVNDYWLFDVSNVVNEYRVVEEEHILWEKV